MNITDSLKIIIVTVLISVSSSVALSSLINKSNTKAIIVVDAVKLFNGFNMKIEMEANAASRLKQINQVSDSLGRIIKARQSNGQKVDDNLIRGYRNTLATLQEEYEISNRNINEQVWKRLNPMIAEFGKERRSAVIIGANGMGTVLYNDPAFDKTSEAIIFVNKAYENRN